MVQTVKTSTSNSDDQRGGAVADTRTRVTLRLSEEEHDRVVFLSKVLGRPANDLYIEALNQWLEQQAADPAVREEVDRFVTSAAGFFSDRGGKGKT